MENGEVVEDRFAREMSAGLWYRRVTRRPRSVPLPALTTALAVVLPAACGGLTQPASPFIHGVDWHDTGVWLAADLHTHTRFSDGAHTPQEVAAKAAEYGCDVLAITDHTDRNLNAATPEYHAAIADAKARTPDLVLLTGLEWNVPPGRGDDHATVLLPAARQNDDRWATEFKRKFDDLDSQNDTRHLLADGFGWLGARASGESGDLPLVFLNHPARRARDVDAVARQLASLAREGGAVFAGVEGAPGHQRATPLGAYSRSLQPEDRWDPAVGPPGAAWDQQLAGGRALWGALASSDFHSESNGDYWPCQFSVTWVYAPERSVDGVLRALRAGTFAAVHSGVTREVRLRLEAAALPRPAVAGETIRLDEGTALIELHANVPTYDRTGQPNRIDLVEFIGITGSGASVIHTSVPNREGKVRFEHAIPAGGFAVRARGRRIVDGPDLLFYTNPIIVQPSSPRF